MLSEGRHHETPNRAKRPLVAAAFFGSALSPNLVVPPANADVFSFNTGNVTDSLIDPSPRPSPRKSGEREK